MSDWGVRLKSTFLAHSLLDDVDDTDPADQTHVQAAYQTGVNLLCYFGHGEVDRWETAGSATLESTSLPAKHPIAVISIACKTSQTLGPDAVTSGVTAWLGFTIRVGIIAPYASAVGPIDTIGDAMVEGLKILSTGATMQQARDEIEKQLDDLVNAYDTGAYAHHIDAEIGYFVAGCMRDHVVVHGTPSHTPL
jgi:hypothetical protein